MNTKERNPMAFCDHDVLTPLGMLGHLFWVRCRSCGHDFVVPAEDSDR